MDRPVGFAEIGRCFACHSTASTIGDKFDEENLILGVTCEACHGPGAKHVAAMKNLMKGNLDAPQSRYLQLCTPQSGGFRRILRRLPRHLVGCEDHRR